MTTGTTLRVARPTDQLDAVVRFYTDGVGLTRLGAFEDHDDFEGVMLGVPGAPYHLEFTRKRGHVAGRAPTEDNLLVFYLPDAKQWQRAVDRMVGAGYTSVPSFNPYRDRAGRTFEDPDGYAWCFRTPAGRREWRRPASFQAEGGSLGRYRLEVDADTGRRTTGSFSISNVTAVVLDGQHNGSILS